MGRSAEQKKKTEAVYKKIADLNDGTLTDSQIAKKLNVSEATVSRGRKFFGIKKIAPYKGFKSGLTKEAIDWIIENSDGLTDEKISKKFKISKCTALKWRTKIGLFYDPKTIWDRHIHPKGFKGGKHNARTKKICSEVSKKMWADPDHTINSEEQKQIRSDSQSKFMATRHPSKVRSRGAAGYRKDLGEIYFRSSWEANYARYLNLLKKRGELYKWEYEPEVFWFEKIKRGVRSYKPDFKLWDTEGGESYFVEVKGYMDAKSKTKIKRMRIYYPEIKLKVFNLKSYKGLKNLAHIIPNWEYCSAIKVGEKWIK